MIAKIFNKLNSLFHKTPFIWALLYFAIIGGSVAFAANFYEKIKMDQLPSGNIELVTSKNKYNLGDEIKFTVMNHFSVSIYVTNQCPNEPLNVYRWENGEWNQIHDQAKDSEAECYDEERNVEILPENSKSYNFNDWPNLFKNPGVYRLAMTVDHSSDVFFTDFAILEPAKVTEVVLPGALVPSLIEKSEAQVDQTIKEDINEEDNYNKVYRDDDEFEEEDDD